MRTAKQLRRRISQLESHFRAIRYAKSQLNPVHFDTSHQCGRFMHMLDGLILDALGPAHEPEEKVETIPHAG
jgi:hypothetical protein